MLSSLESKLEYIYVSKNNYLLFIKNINKLICYKLQISCLSKSKAFLLMKKSIIDAIDFLFNNGNVLLLCLKWVSKFF
jgi:hypothetical protein